MNNWWLDLYTIPSLKNTLKYFLLITIVAVAISFFAPALMMYTYGFVIIPMFANILDSGKSVAGNIHFHKMHIPFKELRSAYLKDVLIRCSTLIVLSSLFCFGVSFFAVIEFDGEVGATCLWFFFMGLFIQFQTINLPVNGKYLYKIFDPSNKIKTYAFLLPQIILGLVIYYVFGVVDTILRLDSILYAFFFISTLFCTVWIFSYRAVFHQEKSVGSFWTPLKYQIYASLFLRLALLVVAIVSAPLVNLKGINPTIRTAMFISSGAFGPNLDIEHGREVLNQLDEASDYKVIFKRTPGLSELALNELFVKPTDRQMFGYLQSVSHPPVESLQYILTTSKHKQVTVLAMKKLPKDYPAPGIRLPAGN